jgi:hypothetical protein
MLNWQAALLTPRGAIQKIWERLSRKFRQRSLSAGALKMNTGQRTTILRLGIAIIGLILLIFGTAHVRVASRSFERFGSSLTLKHSEIAAAEDDRTPTLAFLSGLWYFFFKSI